MDKMIYDCFTFYNELDILEIRLSLLYPFTDFFVLVEANKSWRLNPKPFVWEENISRFREFEKKIIYVKVEDLPGDKDPWKIEEFQRNAILRGLKNCTPDDLIIIADVDEIWDPRILRDCQQFPSRIEMPFYYYNMNYRVNEMWTHPVICRYSDLQNTTPNQLRQKTENLPVIPYQPTDLSFHFSFFYGKDYSKYAEKIENYNHTEYDRPLFKSAEHIQCCVKYGIDIFLRQGVRLKYCRNRNLRKIKAFARFKKYYHARKFFWMFPTLSNLKALFRIYLYRKFPEIRHDNPIGNSLKYVIKRKLSFSFKH